MNIDDMYRICQFCVNKSQNGYLTPSEFNLIINQAQLSFQNYLLGEFQQYQYIKGEPRIVYSLNENIRQRLAPFIIQTSLSIDGSGFAAYPADYLQVDAIRKNNTFERVRLVQQDSLYSYYNSHIDPVSTNPIYLIEPSGFRFYPVTLSNVQLSYIKVAPHIVWAYTLDGNGRPIYNSSGSTQPLWYDVDKLEIISRALKLIGINLQMPIIEQYANQITQNGQ